MGLGKILTTPIEIGSSKFSWREPASYRIRLRGDGWLRLGVILGSWALGAGIFSAVFATNVHRPGPLLAVGLGSLFGLLAATLTFFLREHVSGRVQIDFDEIRRTRSFAGITPGAWQEWQYWPYPAIQSCAIVPAAAVGKSFSVLVLTLGDHRDIVGIPRSVDVAKLAKFLTLKGVTVTQGKSVPRTYTTRLNPAVAGSVMVAGLLVLAGGITWLESARAGIAADDQQWEPEGPQFAEGNPGPASVIPPPIQPAAAPVQSVPEGDFPAGDVPEPAFGAADFRRPRFGFGGPPAGLPGFQPPPLGGPPLNEGPGVRGFEQASKTDMAAKAAKSDLVGAPGGFDFVRINGDRTPVIGFRSTFGRWAGKQWIGRLEPLYGGEQPAPGWDEIEAKPGYAVAGLLIDAPEFVNAYAVLFQRLNPDGTLDSDDSYTSEWIGPKSEAQEQTVSADGKPVLGIYGRAGAILNAVGLLLDSE